MSAGKGSKPRNCFSDRFWANFEAIRWNKKKTRKGKPMKRAFTLIEFLIVASVIVLLILAGIHQRYVTIGGQIENGPMATRISRMESYIDEWEYQGHRYLDNRKGSLIHAEHCGCRTNRVEVWMGEKSE